MTRKRLLRPEHNPWWVGAVGRTIYAQLGDRPDEDDPLIGVMDTKALAQAAVQAHNDAVAPDRLTPTPKRERGGG